MGGGGPIFPLTLDRFDSNISRMDLLHEVLLTLFSFLLVPGLSMP